MIFTVIYRDKAGQRATLELDVPSKSAVWPELKKRGIYHLKTVYSEEQPATPIAGLNLEKNSVRRQTPSSISFVPPVVGMIIASEVIKDLIKL